MAPKHKHHIVPRHAGGDDSPENLTPPISIRMHAMFHYDRWKNVGDVRDWVACRFLMGMITKEAARVAVAKLPRSTETRAKMSRARTGTKLSPEHYQKTVAQLRKNHEAARGKKITGAAYEALLVRARASGLKRRGIKLSAERRAQISEAGKGRKKSELHKEKIREAIRWTLFFKNHSYWAKHRDKPHELIGFTEDF